MRRLENRVAVIVTTRIVVPIKIRKIAAGNIQPNPVPLPEQIAGRIHLNRVFVNPVRFNQRRVFKGLTIPRTYNSMTQLLDESVRPDIHQPGDKIRIPSR